ncbi:MAG: starch-binding protein, partial [Muribaculaceae bacterium]|nr:starch-binding protein [Muribaculaceae bacterium]
YNSAFGTETQLRNMIKTFKQKGTGIIADVVINHRCGKSNWTDFPKEEWNGQTYQLGPQHICSSDEVKYESGQAKPTGAPDTGEDFGSARDLDHTNAEVQRNCKAYCQFLIQDMGYVGFRYDMTKGYSGYYNKLYNEASHPTFSVGEYFDGNYDKVKEWIEATGRQSAAFDFPCKYAINEAFASNDMTKLSWKANGTTDQPAGMIHFGYAQYAVTFVDNHDTYRDGSKFNGNVLAANAFILCSPGTPCVFWPHYTANKAAIQKLIEIRNAVGVHNQSGVKVLQLSRDCYMAEVYGSKGTLVVKIGGAMASPAGYTNADIKASGDGYCVWTKASIGGGNTSTDIPTGESFKVYYDNSNTQWATPHIYYWGGTEPAWPGVAMTKEKDNVWSYTVPAGTTGILFNAGDGDATKTSDFDAVANHIYTNTGDAGVYNGSQGGGNDTPSGTEFTVYFDNSQSNWATPYIYYWGGTKPGWPGVPMNKVKDNVWSYTVPAGTTGIIFNAGDGDATKTPDFDAVANHIYTTSGDQGVYNGAQGGGNDTPNDKEFNVYFDNSVSNWATPYIYYWGGTKPEWPGVPMNKAEGNIWKYTVPAGTTGIIFNAGDGDASKTPDFDAVPNHLYTTAGDRGVYSGAGGDDPVRPSTYPETLYLVGNIEGHDWTSAEGIAQTSKNDGVYT